MEPRKLVLSAMVFAIVLSSHVSAQNDISCPSDELNDQLILTDPRFARSYMYLEQAIQQQLALSSEDRVDDIYTLPVVVHIIHEGEPVGTGSNISDLQIFSAIEAVNNDFRKTAGTSGDGDGVDTGIQFCLAVRDPNGNSTNGIVRVNGAGVTNYADYGIEATGGVGADEAAVKGLSTWPREDYLNIWIVNEIEDNNAGSGIQGFAYFPVDSPLDGIVILHNAFGTVGNVKASTNMNRTFTHEAGHYLALYHTFHNTTTCNVEANCSTAGDHVCDTPVTPLQTSCSSPACSGTQQVENYLDYTGESCRNMFSDGQKVRMRTTLQTDRSSLLSSLGCMPVSDYDCGISYIDSPAGSTCESFVIPGVYLTNYGSVTLTSCSIHYNIDGVGNSVYNWTGSLATSTSILVNLPGINSGSGTHQFIAWSTLPNTQADENSANDQASAEYTVSFGGTATLTVELDYFGSETTWEVTDSNNDVLASGGSYVNNQQGLEMTENICLTTGCYTLTFFDAYGDGQGFTSGSFTLMNGNDSILVYESGNWGEEISNDFCLEEIIPEGQPPVSSFNESDNLICKNSNIDFTDLSGNSPSSWTWTFEGGAPATSSQQHPQNIAYNTAGSFDVTLLVSNAFGSNSYTCANCIVVSAGPNVTVSKTDVSCFNGNNGTATANPTGGNSPYTYSWNSGQNTQNITQLVAGTYTVTVTDEDGCSKSQNSTIAQPTAITLSANITDVSCYQAGDGELSASASGGTSPYTYSWNNGQTGAAISDLDPGTYMVTATDNLGCQKQQNYSIDEPEALTSDLMDFDIGCSGITGSAQVSPSGGTFPYSVTWSNGMTGIAVSGLSTGNYSVNVEDANGCIVNNTFTISQSESLSVNLTTSEISCSGEMDGEITCLVSGGTGDYTFDWNNGSSNQNLLGVGPGTYEITVTDSEGCSGSSSVILANPAAIALAVFKTDISCFGMLNGTATATATGGSGGFSYAWSSGQNTSTVGQLSEGMYMVIATDNHGCAESETITIVEPSQLVAACAVLMPETCEGGDGEAVVNVLGGTPGYDYSWNNGAQGMMITEVSSGVYSVIVTDGNGCVSEATAEIPYECDVEIPTIQLSDTDCGNSGYVMEDIVYCQEVADAEMYRWKFSNATSGEMLTEEYSLAPAFMLSEVDGLGYGITLLIQVKVMMQGAWGEYGAPCSVTMENELPVTGLVSEDCGAQNVLPGEVISAQLMAGASSYEWHITGDNYDFTTYTITNELTLTSNMQFVSNGTYYIEVRCLLNGQWTEFGPQCSITFGLLNSIEENELQDGLTVYPNPGDGTTIFIDFGNIIDSDEVKDLAIFGATGNLIEEIQVSVQAMYEQKVEYKFRHPLPTGMYLIKYTLNGESREKKLIVR